MSRQCARGPEAEEEEEAPSWSCLSLAWERSQEQKEGHPSSLPSRRAASEQGACAAPAAPRPFASRPRRRRGGRRLPFPWPGSWRGRSQQPAMALAMMKRQHRQTFPQRQRSSARALRSSRAYPGFPIETSGGPGSAALRQRRGRRTRGCR